MLLTSNHHKLTLILNCGGWTIVRNLLSIPNFVNGSNISGFIPENSGGIYSIVSQGTPEGNSYALKQSYGAISEYEIQQTSFLSGLKPNTKYRYSMYVSNSFDFDGDEQTMHTRFYDGVNIPYTTGGIGKITSGLYASGILWEKRVLILTTPSTINGIMSMYVGYPTSGTKGYRMIADIKFEEVYR